MLVIDRLAGRAVFVVGNSTRPVDPVAIRLLTGVADGPGSTDVPMPVIALAATTVALVLIAGAGFAAYRARTRLQLVRATAGALLGLSLWRVAGPWDHAPGPVSYTHLDVYKRQQLIREGVKEAMQKGVRCRQVDICLLYTSRCV